MVTAYRGADAAALTKQDEEQLKLLAVLHYCYAVMVGLMAGGIGLFGILPGILVASAPRHANDPPPLLIGGILFAVFGFIAVLFLAKAVLTALAARALTNRRNRTLILVAACLTIPNFPLGTALGVFTLMLIEKPAVKALFTP
jgi:hypothetical protein